MNHYCSATLTDYEVFGTNFLKQRRDDAQLTFLEQTGSPTCARQHCSLPATHSFSGDPHPKCCEAHRFQGMVRFLNLPSQNLSGETHIVSDDEEQSASTTCQHQNCRLPALFNYGDNSGSLIPDGPQFCQDHKLPGMIADWEYEVCIEYVNTKMQKKKNSTHSNTWFYTLQSKTYRWRVQISEAKRYHQQT